MKLFKTVAKIFIVLGIVILLCASFFFVKDYFDKSNKYSEYKQQAEKTIVDNTNLLRVINILQVKQKDYDNERISLMQKIDQQKKEILAKESTIIKNNTLIIPGDYNTLRVNYTTLYDLYTLQKIIDSELVEQSEKDKQQIIDLSKALDDAKNNIQTSTQVIQNYVEKPVPFIQQYALIGGGVDPNNKKNISVAYMILLKDKLALQAQLEYPLKIGALVGIKL